MSDDQFRVTAIGKNFMYGERTRDGETETGIYVEPEEGKPITRELLELKDTDEPFTYDVRCLHKPSHAGPARANSRAYRQNWDDIFGKKPELLN